MESDRVKMHHKINHGWVRPTSPMHSEPTSERYEGEIGAAIQRAEKACRKAQRSLDRVLERQRVRAVSPDTVERLRAAAARRWSELRELELQMQRAPGFGGSQHSGQRGRVRSPLPKGSKL